MQVQNGNLFSIGMLFLSFTVIGCSSSDQTRLGLVSGVVTFDGKPLAGAQVTYCPLEGGRVASSKTKEDGSYYLEYTMDRAGALVGEHEICVSTAESSNEGRPDPLLPPVYNTNTKLKVSVVEGQNTFNIPLTSKGIIPVLNN